MSAVADAVASVVCPVTPSVPPRTVFPDTVSAVADAVESVVCPATESVEEKDPELP